MIPCRHMPRNLVMGLVILVTPMHGQSPLRASGGTLEITDGNATAALAFGIDGSATDGLDAHLQEAELPPLPPAGVFDARFIGYDIGVPLGQGTTIDLRPGTGGTAGRRVHELYMQGAQGSPIRIRWQVGGTVTATLNDLYTGKLINVQMQDSGSCVISDPSVYSRLRLTVDYAATGVTRDRQPDDVELCQNFPNPFNAETTLRFTLPEAALTSVAVFDAIGQNVAGVFHGPLPAGSHLMRFDASGLASGVYIYRLIAGRRMYHKTMTVLK
jgi:hypothetical protein